MILAALLLVATVALPMPANVAEAKSTGCHVRLVTDTAQATRWQVHVWAEFRDGTNWTRLLSMREPDERAKALRDCDRWMKAAVKAANGKTK